MWDYLRPLDDEFLRSGFSYIDCSDIQTDEFRSKSVQTISDETKDLFLLF